MAKKKPKLDATGIYAKWNGPKPDPDIEAQAAVEQTGPENSGPEAFMTDDPKEPLDATAIYNKWNRTA